MKIDKVGAMIALNFVATLYNADSLVARSLASGVVDSGLIGSQVKPRTLKLVSTDSLLNTQQ